MLLNMVDIQKRFGQTFALRGVNLDVYPGEVHAIAGENGAGKSTLMKVLSGVHTPDAGIMTLDGADYSPPSPRDARMQGVIMVHQELALAEHLSVAENIVLGVEPASYGILHRNHIRAKAKEALTALGHPDVDPDTSVGHLPVATRQIIEIARGNASGCRILVLDEPTSSLTLSDTQRLFSLIRMLKARGCAILYISHVLEEVKEIADRITVLRDGQTVATAPSDEMSIADIITAMAGRSMDDLYPRSPRTRGKSVLSLQALSGAKLPRSASLELHEGEVLGIAGLVGAGRTELLRCIFGLDRVVSGSIRLATYEGAAAPDVRLAQGMGMLSEDRRAEGLATNLSIAENITLSSFPGRWGFTSPARKTRVANRWIQELGIRAQHADQSVQYLSGGNQQKVALARLLHHDVDVFLLDEPTRGIDVASKARMYNLIDQLATGNAAAKRPARAVLIVSSYIPELLGVCDRIAVMCRGQLGPARPVAEWTDHDILAEATGSFPNNNRKQHTSKGGL